MHSNEADVGFIVVVLGALVALVVFLIYKCCTYFNRSSVGGAYSPSYSQGLYSNESSSDPLDLHGDTCGVALGRLGGYLNRKKRAGRYSATVITGRGLHSPFQRPVLKPAVEDWLDRNGYRYVAHDGHFIVYL